jgi:DNA polymerase bacteriophage-type
MTKRLHLDFETASRVDLRKVGASRYAADPSTMVLCVAWAWDDGPVQSALLPDGEFMAELLLQMEQEVGGVLHAWNASFELAILRNHYGLTVPVGRVSCSMQRSLYGGFPASLEQAGPAMKLPRKFWKSSDGHKLMMKMCKPRTMGQLAGTWWHDDPKLGLGLLNELANYCMQDVVAERAAASMVPALPPFENQISVIDRIANTMGVRLDPRLIYNMILLAKEETRRLDVECAALTGNRVTSPGTQTARLMQWLTFEGWPLPDVGKEIITETLEFAVDAEMPADVQRVLSIRQSVAKSSVKKLATMLACVERDECVRGSLQYYGAGRTGRWAGRLIQLQNLPRPIKGLNTDAVIFDILAGVDVDYIRTFYGDPLAVISACLRGCVIAREGKSLMVFDFSQIEARVLAWLGNQQDVLDVFASGADIYDYTAKRNGFASRDTGKVMVLGLGFGMGHLHFIDFAKKNGVIFDEMEAQGVVTAWRGTNTGIVHFWNMLDGAVKYVLRQWPAHHLCVGQPVGDHLKVRLSKGKNGDPLLTIQLPSGRSLFYRNARLELDAKGREAITYDGVDQYTKKWGRVRTWGAKLAENVTQAIARDIMAVAGGKVILMHYVELILSVHDELVFEGDPVLMDDVAMTVTDVPVWADGLPLAAAGKAMKRYRKI